MRPRTSRGNRLVILMYLLINRRKYDKKKKIKRFHIHPINLKRSSKGVWDNLVPELRLDSNKFVNYFRMNVDAFDKLLKLIGPSISPVDYYRETISPGARLAMTLRFLASGDSQVSLSYQYRVGKATVSNIIKETCDVLWTKLKTTVFDKTTESNWLKIASDMNGKWNFPHCIGAIDGKHVVIQAPPNSGSEYYNYKHSHSVVLMAIVDANYRFIMVDIGATGRQSDGGIFKNSSIGRGFEDNLFMVPEPQSISRNTPPLPYVLVGDEAFQLTPYLMRPYPGKSGLDLQKRVFNYRLSRCRRLVENAFGIMSSRFRIFRKPIIGNIDNIMKYIQAATCLHNFIIIEDSSLLPSSKHYIPPGYVDSEKPNGEITLGEWRSDSPSVFVNINKTRMGSNRSSLQAAEMREWFADYFISDEGSLHWQWDHV